MLSLKVGQVFHLWCGTCATPKYKFYVLAQIEPRPRYFLINSNPAAFQRANLILLGHQVPLDARENSFLSRNSVMDCSKLIGGLTASDLEDKYSADPRVLLGTISTAARRAARHIIENSELLTAKEIATLLALW